MKKIVPVLSITALLFLSACVVSKKKYDDMLAQKVKLETDLADNQREAERQRAIVDDISKNASRLRNDSSQFSQELALVKTKNAESKNELDKLNENYKSLFNNAGQLNKDLSQQKNQLLAIQQNLDKTRHANDSLSQSLLKREMKVQELEKILASEQQAIRSLKEKVNKALVNVEKSDLTVTMKNGKLYMSLSEQLLFGSGSVEVDQKGIAVLQQIAKALKENKMMEVVVEGHTDNVPISKQSQYMHDNWDLSVMRATSITRILTKEGLSPTQLIAAGRGQYFPLVANTNAQNQKLNRRIELIITPDLTDLYNAMERK